MSQQLNDWIRAPSPILTIQELPQDSEVRSPVSADVTPDPERPYDFLIDDNEVRTNGYVIQKETRQYNEFIPEPGRPQYQSFDIEYVAVKRSGKLIRKFDAGVFGLGGNLASFGFFPFLGKSSKELFISQDTFRGGCQWVVTFSPKFRVIFDAQRFGVGREGADLRVADLDHDGVNEIIVPLTDFYEFQDKMSISQIPLPEIVFKYDSQREEYLPANPALNESLTNDLVDFEDASTDDELQYRSHVLYAIADLIYRGDREQAWRLFHRDYRLRDKAEMERRVKALLKTQPVYNFIYRNQRYPR